MSVQLNDPAGFRLDRDCHSTRQIAPSSSGTTCAHSQKVTRNDQKLSSGSAMRGFTLVELMIVIAIVGVLATLGMVGFRKYLKAANAAEVKAVIQGIRVSEEAMRAETFQYRGCSANLTEWYPATPDDKKHHWENPAHPSYNCWKELNVTTDGPVRFGYAVVAGIAPDPDKVATIGYCPNWDTAHASVVGPWFVVQAAGDQDNDQVLSLFASSSNTGQICVEPTNGDDE